MFFVRRKCRLGGFEVCQGRREGAQVLVELLGFYGSSRVNLSQKVPPGRNLINCNSWGIKTVTVIVFQNKDDTELRDFAARFDRLDTTVQLQQGAVSLETAQLESRAAVETKDEEAAKRGKPDVWNPEGVGSQMAE